MSWQAAVFAGLALVLVGGFAWYERSRPSARLVALVAALTALAVAGRLALAPVPNLVATTDVAMLTGYALGPGPGFAVGALAAPISNIWLGQGPWTAWQMAGWGLVGLGGAWLAVIAHRRLGRLGLALACGFAGFAYGALLDLSVMVTYGGEQSLDRYLALAARGLPFNAVHAAGNFAIAFAAGPALIRMISRFRTRLEFSWRPAGALPLALLALAGGAWLAAAHPPGTASARTSATAWLERQQASDGGFGATPGQPSSPAMTGWAVLGLEAAGRNPADVRSGRRTALTYLRSEAGRVRSVGDLERTILALTAADVSPRRFAGVDLVERLRKRRDRDGSVDGQVNLAAFYALAMRAAGADPGSLRRTATWLRRAQNADGGWGIQPEGPSEADTTGAALQALVAVGARGGATADGARWLRRAQRRGGGWELGGSGVVNSQSTAWAIQGLVAVGAGAREVDRGLAYIGRLRAADGHYRYSAASDQTPIWVTAQVLMALERQPLPVPPVARASASARRDDHADAGGASGGGGADSSASRAGAQASAPASPGGSPSAVAGGGEGNAGSAGAAATTDSGGGGQPAGERAAGAGAAPPQASSQAPASGSTAASPAANEPAPVSVGYAPAAGDDGSDLPLIVAAVGLIALAAGGMAWSRRHGG